MNEMQILESANERIKKHRMADGIIKAKDSSGKPIAGAEVKVQQTNHAFLFGCNIFKLHKCRTPEDNGTQFLHKDKSIFYFRHLEKFFISVRRI